MSAPFRHESPQPPQLNPQELVPQVRLSLVQEVASQPEHWPAVQVALAEFWVQSKQAAPPLPQLFASLAPGRHTPFEMQPVQQTLLKQTPVPVAQPDPFATCAWAQLA